VASQQCRPDVIECLIQLGADLSATDEDGNTPFMVALAGKKQSLKYFWKYKPRSHLKVQNKVRLS
jgi:ankyrin repeat protein